MNKIGFIIFCIQIFGVVGIGLGLAEFSTYLLNGTINFNRAISVVLAMWLTGLITCCLFIGFFPTKIHTVKEKENGNGGKDE